MNGARRSEMALYPCASCWAGQCRISSPAPPCSGHCVRRQGRQLLHPRGAQRDRGRQDCHHGRGEGVGAGRRGLCAFHLPWRCGRVRRWMRRGREDVELRKGHAAARVRLSALGGAGRVQSTVHPVPRRSLAGPATASWWRPPCLLSRSSSFGRARPLQGPRFSLWQLPPPSRMPWLPSPPCSAQASPPRLTIRQSPMRLSSRKRWHFGCACLLGRPRPCERPPSPPRRLQCVACR